MGEWKKQGASKDCWGEGFNSDLATLATPHSVEAAKGAVKSQDQQ